LFALCQSGRLQLERFDVFWHVLDFFAPALGAGILATTLAKLVWRSELRLVAWQRLTIGSSVAAGLALVVGLLVFGQDGRMATYGAMVAATALGLWWIGFRPFR
jgi:hypothetical protein